MRLWSLHPRLLDARGLVALWREALLAQAVLRGKTRGYKQHPQLERFKSAPRPTSAIAAYLRAVHKEAKRRGYEFDSSKIVGRAPTRASAARIAVTRGQLDFEWKHLARKLRKRDPKWLRQLRSSRSSVQAHPSFRIVRGDIAAWERVPTHD